MMKSTILILGVLAVFAFKANAQHEHHSMDNSAMKHGESVQENDVDVTFQMQFGEVIKSNQLLNEAFVTGEQKKVAKAVTSVQNSLSKVDMKLLSGDAHMKWMEALKTINSQLSIIASAKSITDQRNAFI